MRRLIERRQLIVITVTGPAVAAIALIGYFGINSIVNWVADLFKGNDDDQNRK